MGTVIAWIGYFVSMIGIAVVTGYLIYLGFDATKEWLYNKRQLKHKPSGNVEAEKLYVVITELKNIAEAIQEQGDEKRIKKPKGRRSKRGSKPSKL